MAHTDMGSDDHDHDKISDNYMILRPEEVSLCGLIGILVSSDIACKAFVKIPTGKEEKIKDRWIIFMCLLGQKLLQFFSVPMSKLGSALEKWLNILLSNHNLILLLLRVLQGKVVVPEKTGDEFLSVIGHLDRRVELDKNIKHGDCKYYPMLCAMASKLSYENKAVVEKTVQDCWKMELLGYYDFWNDYQRKATTQGFMFLDKISDPDTIIIAFRGTETFDADAWCTDIDLSWYEFDMGKIHEGFIKALGLVINQGWPKEYEQDSKKPLAYYTLREELKKFLKQNSRTKFILTGHSQGGALAILFPAVLALHEETQLLERLEGVYTFGQPRVGDEKFKSFMENQLDKYQNFKYLRFVYCNDLVPRLPYDSPTFLFKHFGTCLYYNSCYRGKIVEEEPDKNYILLAMIPRFLNAWLELLRSFMMPYVVGTDFKETGLLKFSRFVGLVFPGFAAHNPHDYVNLTRLGFPDDILIQASRKVYGKIVEEEPDKNYVLLRPMKTIQRFLNACWELLRSFMIPYMEGLDFEETGFLKFARFLGLVFHGLAAHNPQDYVNLTRLGFPDDIIIQVSRKIYGKVSSLEHI
ncbi:hypothetical protein Dsin_009150 [Dipteronia sinensis]|uniref:Fungal lipase-type domain-containing protein n=1 Tax=Dipteronia sinensis TaxID=43782 RepID=A0AAE0AQQ5_9ROSI|nr:hypothetical protein Dsin_009150 [Dipteronia sinensis]